MYSLPPLLSTYLFFFFFNDTATTEIYTLSLHDALPICARGGGAMGRRRRSRRARGRRRGALSPDRGDARSEEHTSELQSPCNLVCRLLLEKKKIVLAVYDLLRQSALLRSIGHTS